MMALLLNTIKKERIVSLFLTNSIKFAQKIRELLRILLLTFFLITQIE